MDGRSLLYLASGPIKPAYEEILPDTICLVDYNIRSNLSHIKRAGLNLEPIYNKPPVKVYRSKNNKTYITVQAEATVAIKILRRLGIKFDYLVILNEGLYEGGGFYKLNSELILGYVMPLLRDEYIHYINIDYYPYRRKRKKPELDLPYETIELGPRDEGYIDPKIFSNMDGSQVFLMKKALRKVQIDVKKRKVFLINDSLWNYYDEMDIIFSSYRHEYAGLLLEGESKVINMLPYKKVYWRKDGAPILTKEYVGRVYTLDEVLSYCVQKGVKKLGITLFNLGYRCSDTLLQFLKMLRKHELEYPAEVYVFHLNKGDFKMFYEVPPPLF